MKRALTADDVALPAVDAVVLTHGQVAGCLVTLNGMPLDTASIKALCVESGWVELMGGARFEGVVLVQGRTGRIDVTDFTSGQAYASLSTWTSSYVMPSAYTPPQSGPIAPPYVAPPNTFGNVEGTYAAQIDNNIFANVGAGIHHVSNPAPAGTGQKRCPRCDRKRHQATQRQLCSACWADKPVLAEDGFDAQHWVYRCFRCAATGWGNEFCEARSSNGPTAVLCRTCWDALTKAQKKALTKFMLEP